METGKPRTNPNNTQAHRPLPRHQKTINKTSTNTTTPTLKLRTPPRQRAATHKQIQNPPRKILSQVLLPPQPRHLRPPHQTANLPSPIKEPPPKSPRQVPVPPQAPRVPRASVPVLLRLRNRHVLATGLAPDVVPEREGLCLGLSYACYGSETAAPAGRHICPCRGAAG